jgi:hypothetical protein
MIKPYAGVQFHDIEFTTSNLRWDEAAVAARRTGGDSGGGGRHDLRLFENDWAERREGI